MLLCWRQELCCTYSALSAALQGAGSGLVSQMRKVRPRGFIWLEQLARGRAGWKLLPSYRNKPSQNG